MIQKLFWALTAVSNSQQQLLVSQENAQWTKNLVTCVYVPKILILLLTKMLTTITGEFCDDERLGLRGEAEEAQDHGDGVDAHAAVDRGLPL